MTAPSVRNAVAAAALGACLVACTDEPDTPHNPPPDSAAVCRGAGATMANSGGPAFEIEQVGSGGPFLHRYLRVDADRDAGHLCIDIVIDHADPGSEATGYTLTATQGDRTWEQSGTDPDDEDPLKVDVRGCVDVTATLTVVGAGDEEYEYRAEGEAGIGCRT